MVDMPRSSVPTGSNAALLITDNESSQNKWLGWLHFTRKQCIQIKNYLWAWQENVYSMDIPMNFYWNAKVSHWFLISRTGVQYIADNEGCLLYKWCPNHSFLDPSRPLYGGYAQVLCSNGIQCCFINYRQRIQSEEMTGWLLFTVFCWQPSCKTVNLRRKTVTP
jgi:hypothetical protein